jgi:tartrate dehydratase beta subunit/fumarate hydratase class I family protein
LSHDQVELSIVRRKIRALKVGDEVLISGIVFTGRDAQGLPESSIGGRLAS